MTKRHIAGKWPATSTELSPSQPIVTLVVGPYDSLKSIVAYNEYEHQYSVNVHINDFGSLYLVGINDVERMIDVLESAKYVLRSLEVEDSGTVESTHYDDTDLDNKSLLALYDDDVPVPE